MGKNYVKLSIIISLITLLTLFATGCDRQACWREAIASAIAKTSEAESYRTTGNSTSCTNGETTLLHFEMEYVAPDRSHSKSEQECQGNQTVITVEREGFIICEHSTGCRPSWVEMIVIGDRGYARSSDDPDWTVCRVFTPRPNPTATPVATPWPTNNETSVRQIGYISMEAEFEIFNWLVDLEKLPDERINGVNCSHYYGEVDMDSYMDMVLKRLEEYGNTTETPEEYFNTMRRQVIFFELWIDSSGYIRQIVAESHSPSLNPDTGEEVWISGLSTRQYFDFNEPITIEPPQIH